MAKKAAKKVAKKPAQEPGIVLDLGSLENAKLVALALDAGVMTLRTRVNAAEEIRAYLWDKIDEMYDVGEESI